MSNNDKLSSEAEPEQQWKFFFSTYRKHKGQSLVCDESVYSEDSGNKDSKLQ